MKIEYRQKLPDPKYCNGCIAKVLMEGLISDERGVYQVCPIIRGKVFIEADLYLRSKECIDKFGE